MGAFNRSQLYGRNMPDMSGMPTQGPAEAASGPPDVNGLTAPDLSPAVWLLAVLGFLGLIRVLWETAK